MGSSLIDVEVIKHSQKKPSGLVNTTIQRKRVWRTINYDSTQEGG
jgi:hypothetical protein